MSMFSGLPPGPGRRGFPGDLIGSLGTMDVDDPVAGEEFLRLRKHAIGHRSAVVAGPHEPGLARSGQVLAADQLASVLQFLVQPVHEVNMGFLISCAAN